MYKEQSLKIFELTDCIVRRPNSLSTFLASDAPMCASRIIDTSFAPSPIESVIQVPFDFASSTTSAFYLGVTLQQITDEANRQSLKNSIGVLGSLLFSANSSVGPSMIMQTFLTPF